jgi:putative transposase
MKLLYLAIRNINQKRGSQGTGTYRWTEALNSFAIQFPGPTAVSRRCKNRL